MIVYTCNVFVTPTRKRAISLEKVRFLVNEACEAQRLVRTYCMLYLSGYCMLS